MFAGEAGQHVVGFLDFFIDMFLEVQDKRYSQILYLIDYRLWASCMVQNIICQGNLPKTYSLTSWLRQQSVCHQASEGLPRPKHEEYRLLPKPGCK